MYEERIVHAAGGVDNSLGGGYGELAVGADNEAVEGVIAVQTAVDALTGFGVALGFGARCRSAQGILEL